MKASLKVLMIKANSLRVGYIIRIDYKFAVVVELSNENTAIVEFIDKTQEEYEVKDLLPLVVKFIAVMKDYKSYPIVHGDFMDIICFFDSEDKVKRLIEGHSANIKGNIEAIYAYPKLEDVTHLKHFAILEKHPHMLNDKLERIGIITEISDNLYTIKFPNNVLKVKRSSFDILNNLDNKYVFKLER